MNPEIKAKWLEALCGGKYQQGKNVLRSQDDKYCCLGVLADIIAPTGWASSVACFVHESGGYMPSLAVCEAAGITKGQAFKLANMNDDELPFPEIAEYIEANL